MIKLSKEDIKKLTREDVIEYSLRSESIWTELLDNECVREVLLELKRLGIVSKCDDGLYFHMCVKFSVFKHKTDIFVINFMCEKGNVYSIRMDENEI